MTGQRRIAGRRRGVLSHVREHRTFAVVLAPLILGLGLTVQRLMDAIPGPADELPVRLASLGLLAATLLYLASWFFGSYYELDAVERLDEELLRVVPRSELPIIIGTAIALGCLGLASANVVIFGTLLFAIKAIELWSSYPLHNLVRENAHAAEHPDRGAPRPSTGLQAGINAVRRYYLERPWAQVTAVVMTVIMASLVLATFAAAAPERAAFAAGTAAAAVGMLAAMTLQEARTWLWRLRYLRDLDEAQQIDLLEEEARKHSRRQRSTPVVASSEPDSDHDT